MITIIKYTRDPAPKNLDNESTHEIIEIDVSYDLMVKIYSVLEAQRNKPDGSVVLWIVILGLFIMLLLK